MKLGLNKMSKKRQKTTNKKTAQNTQKKSDTKLEVKPTDSKMKSVKRQPKRIREARFDKLDNTANLFPVIASRKSSNVYRIAATLTEEIQPEKLQQALDMVLPYFDVMHVRMKTGVFWYYLRIIRTRAACDAGGHGTLPVYQSAVKPGVSVPGVIL